jgi:hypothetical protein
MGKIASEIKKIQEKEFLTLPQLFEKYPHLAHLQYEELKEEGNLIEETKKQLKLLLD